MSGRRLVALQGRVARTWRSDYPPSIKTGSPVHSEAVTDPFFGQAVGPRIPSLLQCG
jgi:hypothetical protein